MKKQKCSYIFKIIILNLLIIICVNFITITKYVYEFKDTLVEEDYYKSFSANTEININKDSVSIKNCYKLNRKERIELMSNIKKQIVSDRTINNLEAELALHSTLYKIGLFKSRTKDAELEFEEDKRWYVRVGTIIFQILGV